MLKNIARLEIIIAEKAYHLTCENDSPIEHIKEALFQFQKYIGSVEDNVKAQMAAKEFEAKAHQDLAQESCAPEETITEV